MWQKNMGNDNTGIPFLHVMPAAKQRNSLQACQLLERLTALCRACRPPQHAQHLLCIHSVHSVYSVHLPARMALAEAEVTRAATAALVGAQLFVVAVAQAAMYAVQLAATPTEN